MSEENPSIWRSEDEFRDTEIGRVPGKWGCMTTSGIRWPQIRTWMKRILRINADFFYSEAGWADRGKWEVGQR